MSFIPPFWDPLEEERGDKNMINKMVDIYIDALFNIYI